MAKPAPAARRSDDVVSSVRAFNRFYNRKIGVLEEGLRKTRFSLAEVRVLYELANREHPTAAELAAELGLDAGYLSRILTRFKGLGFISRRPSHLTPARACSRSPPRAPRNSKSSTPARAARSKRC